MVMPRLVLVPIGRERSCTTRTLAMSELSLSTTPRAAKPLAKVWCMGAYLLSCNPGCDFWCMNVRYVVGDLVEGTIRFRVEELITKSVCDAIEEEVCVMIVCEGFVP